MTGLASGLTEDLSRRTSPAASALGDLDRRQPRTSDDDSVNGVATDRDGNVSVVGWTLGALGGRNKGASDAWVIKYAR